MRKLLQFILLPIMIFTMSCYRNTEINNIDRPKTLVEIHNRGFNAIKVYIVRDGSSMPLYRIGFVDGNVNKTLMVPSDFFDGTNKICGIEFAGTDTFCTDQLRVSRDSYVTVTFENRLNISSFAVFRFRKKEL